MPVKRMSDGSWATGLDPDKVPEYARKRTRLYIDRPMPQIPKNPLLGVTASRQLARDPSTGAVLGLFPTNVTMLYRPGGLLYRESATPQQ